MTPEAPKTPPSHVRKVTHEELGHRMDELKGQVSTWDTILNREVGELKGEFIRVTRALDRLTEEFKGLRQEIVNLKGRQ